MEILRTPDDAFTGLPGYDFEPHFVDVGDGLRMHTVDVGPRDADHVVLMLHGEPSWSYLYREMISPIVAAGHRAVAPDLIGFGRSDKPAAREDYTYERHIGWVRALIEDLDLRHITLFCQDWGGLIGLRLIVGELADRFDRVVAANTFLPSGREPVSDAFRAWRTFSQETEVFDIGKVVSMGCVGDLSPEVIAAYNAPFPEERYKAGARIFPVLVPISPDTPDAKANQDAWTRLFTYDKPFLTAFSDGDPITRGGDRFLQQAIPGAKGQAHTTIEGAGHFLQEEAGPQLAEVVLKFIVDTAT